MLIAGILCFILSMNAYATPVLLGGPRLHMMAPLIYWEFASDNNWPLAAALAFTMAPFVDGGLVQDVGRGDGREDPPRGSFLWTTGTSRRAGVPFGRRQEVSFASRLTPDWLIVVTSLKAEEFSAADVLAFYRLRWRIDPRVEEARGLIGLQGPPGIDDASARAYVLAHLLMMLLLEPLIDPLEDSPHWAKAA